MFASARASSRLAVACLAGWLALAALPARAADEPTRPVAAAGPEAPRPAGPAAPPTIHSLDDLKKLPPGAVIIICQDLKDGLRLVPNGVLLTPEEYQKYLDQVAQQRAAAGPDRPAVPSVCRLTGQVKENVVYLRAQFEFPTSRPNTAVNLGCARAKGRSISLDGRTPLCQPSIEDGYVIQVEKPGDHQATLELELPLADRGPERGFDLDLPRAPITTLDLDLGDPAVKDVRLTLPGKDGRPTSLALAARSAEGHNRVSALLGALGRLDLAWKGPAAPAGPPLLTARGQVWVHVTSGNVATELTFTLTPRRGRAALWRFLLPRHATLVASRPDDRVASFGPADPQGNPLLYELRLKEPTADPLDVTLQVSEARGDGPLAVGPFAVLDALPHTGSLVVAAAPDVRLTPRPRGEPQVTLTPRAPTDEERRRDPQAVEAYTYRTMLPVEARAAGSLPPFLVLDVETVKEACATRVTHKVALTERGWRVTTDLDVWPLQTGGVDHLEVQVPPGYEDVRRPPLGGRAGQRVELDPASGTIQVTLGPKKTEPFHVTLEGLYPPQPGEDWTASRPGRRTVPLTLPQPRQTRDRGGQVTVTLPREMELVPPQPADPAWEALPPGRSEYTWRTEHAPGRVTISWHFSRQEVAGHSVADVTLSERQARVRQQLVFPAPAPGRVLLWLPERINADRVRLDPERARPLEDESAALPRRDRFKPWPVQLLEPVDRDHPLVVDYSFDLPAPAGGRRPPFPLPLIVPDVPSQVDARVRVWAEPGAVPVLVRDGSWEEVDDVGDRDVLPALSLRGRRPDLPPELRVSEPPPAPLATVLVERALVQAAVAENGYQRCRVRLLLQHVYAPNLDVQFPAPLAGLNLKATLTGEKRSVQAAWQAVDESGQAAEDGRVARVPVPAELARKPLLLDLSYQVLPGRSAGGGLLETTIVPPAPRTDLGRFPVRVQIRLPTNWVPLYREGGLSAEQRWGWRGWLLGPLPALSSADLERWLFSGYESQLGRPAEAGADAAPAGPDDADPATLVCARPGLTPVRVNHVPQQVWLVLCSLAVLAVGLGLYLLSVAAGRHPAPEGPSSHGAEGRAPPLRRVAWLPRALFWPLAGALALAVILASLFWPGILGPVLYGAEPGAVVLLGVLGIQWLVQQRYRRQVVFLPSFARVGAGSSLVRNGSANPPSRPRGEPPTVDAPPPASSAGP